MPTPENTEPLWAWVLLQPLRGLKITANIAYSLKELFFDGDFEPYTVKSQLVNKYNLDAEKRHFSQYDESFGDVDKDALKTEALWDSYEKSHDVKKLVKASDNNIELKEMFKNSLTPGQNEAIIQLKTLSDKIKPKKDEITARCQGKTTGLVDDLYKLHKEARELLTTQYEEAVKNIQTNFSDVQDDLLPLIETAHKDALLAFNKGMIDVINKAHIEEQKERDRIALLSVLYHNVSWMKKHIDELHSKGMGGDTTAVTVGPAVSVGDALKGVKLEDVFKAKREGVWYGQYDDIGGIKTLGGRALKLETGNDGKQTLSITFPSRLNWFYYNSTKGYAKADALTFMQAKKALCGLDAGVEVNLTNQDDPAWARYLGRKMYEAAIEEGYEPDKITIKVNGEKIPMHKVLNEKKDGYNEGLYSTANKLTLAKQEASSEGNKRSFKEHKAKMSALHKELDIPEPQTEKKEKEEDKPAPTKK
jgi:hypothetical protein